MGFSVEYSGNKKSKGILGSNKVVIAYFFGVTKAMFPSIDGKRLEKGKRGKQEKKYGQN